jgi:hypothetical protein
VQLRNRPVVSRHEPHLVVDLLGIGHVVTQPGALDGVCRRRGVHLVVADLPGSSCLVMRFLCFGRRFVVQLIGTQRNTSKSVT